MKKFLIESIAQIVVWGLLGFVVATTALIFAGATGGVAAATAPEANFKLVERFVCPEGSKLVYKEGGESTYRDSDGIEHTGTNISIDCVAADGTTIEGKAGQAIFAVIGAYFLVCFAPLMLPGMLISWILVHLVVGKFFKKPENPATS